MGEQWVEYITLDTAQNVYSALKKLWASDPVMMRGTPLVAGLAGRWSLQHLVRMPPTHLPPACTACHQQAAEHT